MKVRIGYGLGVRTQLNGPELGDVVDAMEGHRVDSLWFSERISGDAPDPLVAMAFAAGRTKKLKLGMSVMVLPGRNPVVLAKELATLDRLSGGRVLPAFGLGVVDPMEQQAFGVERSERAAWFDESLTVLRKCWGNDPVTHHGERYRYDGLQVRPKPHQSPPEVWLGGNAPSELKRVGRLADGWLPSFVTPTDCGRGRETIEAALAEHGRSIDDDHYGVLIPYSLTSVPEALLAGLRSRRPDIEDIGQIVPHGWDALGNLIEQFVAVGTTKFVILPLIEPATPAAWAQEVADAAASVLRLQT